MKETFADRLKQAMDRRGLKQVDLIRFASEQDVKLGKSHMSQYVSGKTVPRAELLHFLAETLQVDEDWLSGKEQEEKAPEYGAEISAEQNLQETEKTGGTKMQTDKRPENMQRITTPELAEAFINEQVKEIRETVKDKKVLLALSGGGNLHTHICFIGRPRF